MVRQICPTKDGTISSTDLISYQKGDRKCKIFLLIKGVLEEIISGLEARRSQSARNKWSKRLHELLFYRTFVFNQDAGANTDVSLNTGIDKNLTRERTKIISSMTAQCIPLPSFHPNLYFDLVDEVSWMKYIGEVISRSDLAASLKYARLCLGYVSSHPPLPSDSNFTTSVVDYLISCCAGEILFQKLQSREQSGHLSTGPEAKRVWEQKVYDISLVAELVNVVVDVLKFVEVRNCTKPVLNALVNSDSPENANEIENMSDVFCVNSHMLGCIMLLSIISLSPSTFCEVKATLSRLFSPENSDIDEVDSVPLDRPELVMHAEVLDPVGTDIQQHLLKRLKDCQYACLQCILSFFLPRDTSLKRIDDDRVIQTIFSYFGNRLPLELCMLISKHPFKTTNIVREFSIQLRHFLNQQEPNGNYAEFQNLSSQVMEMLKILEKRESHEEERRRNPMLEEVVWRVKKKLPRWKACLEFGLANRDVVGWWYSGFLDLLETKQELLNKESDVLHLLSILAKATKITPSCTFVQNVHKIVQLTLKVFSGLSMQAQGKIILDVYLNTEMSDLPLVQNYDQSLTVTFNKLTANTSSKDLQRVLLLALHDPLTLAHQAVRIAISSAGQIPLVVKILQMMPEVCRCKHPVHHVDRSLLCHCIHTLLMSDSLDNTEEKNCIALLSALVETYRQDDESTHLLPPSEFLTTSVLPFISSHADGGLAVSRDFSLRLLICILEATLSVGLSDWLKEMHPPALLVCCAEILQECWQKINSCKWEEVEFFLKIKILVLKVMDFFEKHFTRSETTLTGKSLEWLLVKCVEYDWTVVAHLASFISPISNAGSNQVLADFSAKAVTTLPTDPLLVLQLVAISDEAKKEVLQAVMNFQNLELQEMVVLKSLCQLLPHLLVSEVRRVVQVLSALVAAGHLDISFRCVFSDAVSIKNLQDWHQQICVAQLLMDAAVLISSQIALPHLTHDVFLNIAKNLVASLQELLQSAESQPATGKAPSFLGLQVFLFVCGMMSAVPDIMLDQLFVVLLDILSRFPHLTQPTKQDYLGTVKRMLEQGIQFIPRKNMQESLTKKLG